MKQPVAFKIKNLNADAWILPDEIAPGKGLQFTVGNVAGSKTGKQELTAGKFRLKFTNADAEVSTEAGFNLFSTDDEGRKATYEAFVQFQADLDQLQQDESLAPGAARLITQTTAQYLPLPLAETPLYYFNLVNPVTYSFLDSAQTYADVLQGMRLQVYHSNFYTEPGLVPGTAGQPAKSFAAYAGTGTEELYVSSIPGSDKISFSPFFSQVKVQFSQASKSRTAAGGADLMDDLEQQPYNRLFYPNSFKAVNIPDNDPLRNAVLVRARTYPDMVNYTDAYPACCKLPGVATVFFGRAEMVPEVSVRINGSQEYVPIGTTLRHVVERELQSAVRPRGLRFSRVINQAVTDITFENPLIGFDMFLVQGDDITW